MVWDVNAGKGKCLTCRKTFTKTGPKQKDCSECLKERRKRVCVNCGAVWLVKSPYSKRPKAVPRCISCRIAKLSDARKARREKLKSRS